VNPQYALEPLATVAPEHIDLYKIGGLAACFRPELRAVRLPTPEDPTRWAQWTAYIGGAHPQALTADECAAVLAGLDPAKMHGRGRGLATHATVDLPEAVRRMLLDKIAHAARSAVEAWSPGIRLECVRYSHVIRYRQGSHFDRHADAVPDGPLRVMGAVVLLDDPETYDGGELLMGPGLVPAPRIQGTIVVMPSLLVHEVTPITRGTRHVVTSFIEGFGGWAAARPEGPTDSREPVRWLR
jgi:predicted 2-oxoglutarate/Fe(II)-dependent dioxygenase YbiX